MNAQEMHKQIFRIFKRHALSAQASQYDRTVAITAIARARAQIEVIAAEESAHSYGEEVMSELVAFHQDYNDPDGEYTNGRGVLGSLLADLEAVVKDS